MLRQEEEFKFEDYLITQYHELQCKTVLEINRSLT